MQLQTASLIIVLLTLSGCGDQRGIHVDRQGGVEWHGAAAARQELEGALQAAIVTATGEDHVIAISPDPIGRYDIDPDRPSWYWPQATVTVTLGDETPLADVAAIRDTIERGMRPYLTSTVHHLTIRWRKRMPDDAGEPAVTVASTTAARRYVVQEGDTLSDICVLFYGDAQPWRRVLAANPGLDPAALPVGDVILIPAAE